MFCIILRKIEVKSSLQVKFQTANAVQSFVTCSYLIRVGRSSKIIETSTDCLHFKRSKYSSAYRFGFSVSSHLLKFIELVEPRMKFLVLHTYS